jgi:hypothetical protein
MGNNEEIMKAINKIISIQEFASKVPPIRTVMNTNVNVW